MELTTTANSTENTTVPTWDLPFGLVIVTVVYMVLNITVSLLINALLLVIIQYSPSLKTPPNSHLMNICTNNLLLCVSMLLSVICVHVNSVDLNKENSKMLAGLQLFLVFNALLQYWGTFASIGYYRYKTIKEPTLSIRARRKLVSRSIKGNWIVSLLLSMTCSLSYAKSSDALEITLDPFRKDFFVSSRSEVGLEQLIVMLCILGVFLFGLGIICLSYYSIFKMLNVTGTFAKNRVTPWQRAPSLASDGADLTLPTRRSYQPESQARPFTVSSSVPDNLIVHYQKCDHSLAFEDILALENPILAASIQNQYKQKQQLQATLSNNSTTSMKSRCPDFTDISLGADLERLQKLKNKSALRNQSLKRDRISLSSATKNSLVMFCAYLVCSLPLILCSSPCALENLSPQSRVITLLFCRLIFCFNAPVYPTWYFLFSKRVRKCLGRLGDALLLRLNLRR